MPIHKELKKRRRYLYIYFVVVFSILIILFYSLIFYFENIKTTENFDEVITTEYALIELQKMQFIDAFKTVFDDIQYLNEDYSVHKDETITRLQLSWLYFMKHHQQYSKLKIINKNGQEILHITNDENGTVLTPEHTLEFLSNRYYFNHIKKFKKPNIYLSQFDLSVKNNIVEIPQRPTIRIGIPLFDDNGNFEGAIFLNLLASDIIKNFKTTASHGIGSFELLNDESYWLISKDNDKNWGFMFKDKYNTNFALDNKYLWDEIKNKKNGIVVNENGAYIYSSFNLNNLSYMINLDNQAEVITKKHAWHIISYIERTGSSAHIFYDNHKYMLQQVLKKNFIYTIFILLISTLLTLYKYTKHKRTIEIEYQSQYDHLTHVYNRRMGLSKLKKVLPDNHLREALLSICFIDINNLKEVNDQLGHHQGDDLIISSINIIKNEIRHQDFIFRLGGDEFIVVFEGIDKETAEHIWRRILNSIERFNQSQNKPYTIGISHGIVSYNKHNFNSVNEFINAADTEMYHDKKKYHQI